MTKERTITKNALRSARKRIAELEADCAGMSKAMGLPPTVRPTDRDLEAMVSAWKASPGFKSRIAELEKMLMESGATRRNAVRNAEDGERARIVARIKELARRSGLDVVHLVASVIEAEGPPWPFGSVAGKGADHER